MTRRMRANWMFCSLSIFFFICFLSGCDQNDSGNYRSVSEQGIVSRQEQNNLLKPAESNIKPAQNESVPDLSVNTSRELNESDPTKTDKNLLNPPVSTKIEVLIKEKSFRTDRKNSALYLAFEDLDLEKVLNLKEVNENPLELMPNWLKDLRDKKVRIRGFMVPGFVMEGIEHFVLARDTQACCFGPNPKIDYIIAVNLMNGKTTNYIPETRSFDVIGTFKIEPQGKSGKLFGLYRIEDAEVLER